MSAPEIRKNLSVAVVTHVVFSNMREIYGPAHSLMNYVKQHRYNYLFIRFDLYHKTYLLIETNQKSPAICTSHILSRLSFLGDILYVFFIILKFGKIDIFIGIDPLNALAGLILRFIGRTKLVVYFSVDYSASRFGAPILDFLYRMLDTICAKKANEVWNVSKRIYNLRKRQNLDKSKIIYVPNSPEFGVFKIHSHSKVRKHSIVLVSNLTESIDFELILEALKIVEKRIPDVHLDVIGDGPAYSRFMKLVEQNDMKGKISFLGYINHKKLEQELGKYVVGLAIYSGKDSWNYYRDSMKIREYLAAGIPVVTDSSHSASEDIRNATAGEVIPLNAEALASSLIRILGKKDVWKKYRQNAILLAKKLDKNRILDQAFKRLISTLNP
jgi:glycosyltransferase involved in cell wall biosynthesis